MPYIIFRGTGKQVDPDEAAELDSLGMNTHTHTHTHLTHTTGIGWHFQENAWADGKYSILWLRAFKTMLDDNSLGHQQHLMYMDAHDAHTNIALHARPTHTCSWTI